MSVYVNSHGMPKVASVRGVRASVWIYFVLVDSLSINWIVLDDHGYGSCTDDKCDRKGL